MKREYIGLGFCAISAFLFASRYVAAGAYGSGVGTYGPDTYQDMFQYVGSDLTVAAIVALVAGVVLIVWGELSGHGKRS